MPSLNNEVLQVVLYTPNTLPSLPPSLSLSLPLSLPVYANQHLARGWFDLVKAERQRVSSSQVPEVCPPGVSEVNLASSLLHKMKKHLLQRESYGLVPLSGLGLTTSSQRQL